jgi:hypothetical protein
MGVALLLAKAIGRLLLRPTDDTCAVVEPRGVLRCGLSKSVVLAARCPPTFFRISAPLLLPPPTSSSGGPEGLGVGVLPPRPSTISHWLLQVALMSYLPCVVVRLYILPFSPRSWKPCEPHPRRRRRRPARGADSLLPGGAGVALAWCQRHLPIRVHVDGRPKSLASPLRHLPPLLTVVKCLL